MIENKNLYEETYNQQVIGIGYIDPNGLIMGVNPYIQKLLGYTNDELVGKSIMELSHPDDADLSLAMWQELREKKSQKSEAFQKRYRKKNGEWVWVEIHLSALWSEDGELKHILGFVQDITERHTTQEVLLSQQKLLSTVINSVGDLIFYKDTDQRYLGGNDAWYGFIGLSPQQAVGKTDADIYDSQVAKVFRGNDMEVFSSQKLLVFTEEVVGKDGKVTIFETHKSPLIDEDGMVMGLVGIAHDVTQKREQEKHQRLAQSVFENTAEGIIVTDKDQIITSVNPAFTAITGYSPKEAIGRHPSLLSSGNHKEKFYYKMWEKINSADYWQGEIWNARKDGEIYPELLTISKVKDENGDVLNYIGVFSDITLMKNTQEKLEYIAHHDPLTMLPNRLLLEARLEHSIEWARRDNFKIAVLFLDLDHFKEINDAFGHSLGDEVLVNVAQRLKGLLKEKDTIARIGGDEFIIMLENYEDLIYLEKTIQGILGLFESPVLAKGRSFNLTCSIGVALYPNDGHDM